MSISINVEIKNAEKVVSTFRKYPIASQREFNLAISRIIKNVERDAKRNSPVDTGTLRRSIRSQMKSSLVGFVSANTDYAQAVHNGTNFMMGRPFIRDAFNQNNYYINEQVNSALDRVLKF